MKIAITGASGQLGQLVVEALKKRASNEDIVALARNTKKAATLGVEIRAFDYNQPQALPDALQGIDRLLLISGSELGQRAQQHLNVIRAAKQAGIQWIVYTSLLHADTSGLNLAGEHVETEKALKESGIEYTLLRNGWYSENYTASIAGALHDGALLGSAGEGKISSAPRADYAEAAAVVVSNEKYKGKTFELAGDNAYTLSELAAEISKQSGKNNSLQKYSGRRICQHPEKHWFAQCAGKRPGKLGYCSVKRRFIRQQQAAFGTVRPPNHKHCRIGKTSAGLKQLK